ncbi:MAG TPA: hypothetical protein EYG99_03230, partial [Candidatus Pacebacteria bacterium]|nr:hypothetical protein [Candidatus Paceibacterota bacterium]
MTITKIKKRNKKIVNFDRARIERAITEACIEVNEIDKSFIGPLTDEIIHDLEHYFEGDCNEIFPTVEDVQDVVERHLVSANKYEVVKAYILYRAGRGDE